MKNKSRRYEVLLPVRFNDGTEVPEEILAEAVNEIVERFGAVTFHRQTVEGHWRNDEALFRDDLAILVIDLPDTAKNRKWMKGFKSRWKERLNQVEIWMVSYPIDIE